MADEASVYSAHLSSNEISTLSRLLGVGIYEIFASSLEVNRMLLTAPSLSFGLGDRSWLVLRSEWLETPSESLDYFRLSVRLRDQPDGIGTTPDGALIAPSHILLVPSAKIVAIEILVTDDGVGSERVNYDSAFRFFREDGRDFCVATQQSIAAMCEFTEDHTTMATLLIGSSVRLRID